MLAFLALHPHALRRVHVAGSLWLDSPEERASASLRSALWRLQQAGGDVVEANGALLGLAPAGARVDFREAACLSRALLDAGGADPRPQVEWGVLSGEQLLPDWDDEWVIVEREHHRGLSLQAMERLSERLLGAGALAQALEVALAVYVREPLRETAHRLMIRVHLARARPTRRSAGVRLYERLALTQLRPAALGADGRARARPPARRRARAGRHRLISVVVWGLSPGSIPGSRPPNTPVTAP